VTSYSAKRRKEAVSKKIILISYKPNIAIEMADYEKKGGKAMHYTITIIIIIIMKSSVDRDS
jgi:hypothetical protein